MKANQLDFDLTAPARPPAGPLPAPRKQVDNIGADTVLTVTRLTRSVREILESGIGDVWVEGEISNMRRQSSGHRYFTLKDAGAQLSCVLFARTGGSIQDLNLVDGIQVELFGGLSVYEARGQYQLIVKKGRARGAGHLHARFEALKKKLEAEGLFNPASKKPLPKFPRRVGVVTSPTGAAIRDFLHVLLRRYQGIEVIVNPVHVQGAGAASEIARAIGEFTSWERMPPVDVIVVTRGGGSLEDLWEFNEEVVARAIAASPLPVVSAIGHEIDFTIADFVADYRAPTPSAAAEILSADAGELIARLSRESRRMEAQCLVRLQNVQLRLSASVSSALYREPSRRLRELSQQTDRLWSEMNSSTRDASRALTERLRHASLRLDPRNYLAQLRHSSSRVASGFARLQAAVRHAISSASSRLHGLSGQLSTLDPQATLARGYTITMDADGRPVDSVTKLKPGDKITSRFQDGEAQAVVAGCIRKP
ncbi:MAG: exodeoxyribonuclease VII large subunit [Terrimicrobiaceae bacterium]